MPANLTSDTAVSGGHGHYRAVLPNTWDFALPSGGVLTTVALRAMRAELADDTRSPISATTTFCTPLHAGELEARVTTLRRGNVATQMRCGLSAPGGELAMDTVATFGITRPGPDTSRAMPDLPGPHEGRPFDVSFGGRWDWPFFSNVEVRWARGEPWWTPDAVEREPEISRWFRYRNTPRTADGRLDPLALVPIADTMPGALAHALGQARFYAPSLDLTVYFTGDTEREWLLLVARLKRAFRGYAAAEVEIWDEDGQLVAQASQTMIIRGYAPANR